MGDSNDRLREFRKRAGYGSARKAALRFGWNPSTYASHENGQTPVPQDAAIVYAKAFKVKGGAAAILFGEKATKADARKSRLVELAEKVPTDLETQAADFLELLIKHNRQRPQR